MKTIELPKGFELINLDPQVLNETQQDPAFYVWDNGSTPIATIKGNGKTFNVICAGEMRVIYKDEIYRYSDRLMKAGIDNDKQLSELEEKGELEFYNNAWFEFYDTENPDDFNEWVTYEATDAIKTAIEEMSK